MATKKLSKLTQSKLTQMPFRSRGKVNSLVIKRIGFSKFSRWTLDNFQTGYERPHKLQYSQSIIQKLTAAKKLEISLTGLNRMDYIYDHPLDIPGDYLGGTELGFARRGFNLDHMRPHPVMENEEQVMVNELFNRESMYAQAVDYANKNGLSGYTHIPVNSCKVIDFFYIFNEMFGRQKGNKRTALSPKCSEILDSLLQNWKIVSLDEGDHPIFCRPHLEEPYGQDSSIWDNNKKMDLQSEAGTYRFKLEGHGTDIQVWSLTRWSPVNDCDAVFVFISYKNEDALEALLRELDAFDKARRVENRIITVYGGNDIEIPSKMSWDDLVLPEHIVQSTKEDIEGWIEAEARYKKLHVPYRRGYLFEGPPGNGKTATARTIISQYGFSAYMFNFTNPQMGDSDLQNAFQEAADDAPAVFLLEDIDRVFGCNPGGRKTGVSLQGLLNCLDGLATYDGVVTIATANEPEVLDPAIRLRPGRFDVPVRFDNPDRKMRYMYLDFALGRTGMSKATDACVEEIALSTKGMSMAFIKSIFETAAYISKGDITDEALVEAMNRAKKYYSVMEKSHDREAGFKPDSEGSGRRSYPEEGSIVTGFGPPTKRENTTKFP